MPSVDRLGCSGPGYVEVPYVTIPDSWQFIFRADVNWPARVRFIYRSDRFPIFRNRFFWIFGFYLVHRGGFITERN